MNPSVRSSQLESPAIGVYFVHNVYSITITHIPSALRSSTSIYKFRIRRGVQVPVVNRGM
jgi:hypothetical protein